MRALITGVTGQDGSYLAELLAGRGYKVFGLVRGQNNPRTGWITGLVPSIHLIEADLADQTSLIAAVAEAEPDEVYNLAGVSAPGLAWRQPALAADITGVGVLRLLEAVRLVRPQARMVQASSLATHGPYGAAKLYAHAIAGDYRGRGLHVSTAILGGHHSPRRGSEFLSRRVTRAVARIAAGDRTPLRLGLLDRSQDWGHAADFVYAMSLIAQREPGDYVVSTGDPHTCEEWVETAFAVAQMDWREHVELDEGLSQPTDVAVLSASPDERLLPWTPVRDFTGLVTDMVAADMRSAG